MRGRAVLARCLSADPGPSDGRCWPTPQQALLLRAATGPPDAARAAWAEWRRTVDLDTVDRGSYRMLPLAYKNLVALGVRDEALLRLKGVYLKTWYRNQMYFDAVRPLLAALAAARVPTVLLKGVALVLTAYRDPGLRPMDDVDVLVRARDLRRAKRAAAALGWTPEAGGESAIERMMGHALAVAHPSGFTVDLHWRMIGGRAVFGFDRSFWTDARPIEFEGVPTHVLTAADQLLHVCVHGLKWNPVPPWRWVADALFLMRAGDVAWDALLRKSRRLGYALVIGTALRELARAYEAPVPAAALAAFDATRPSRIEVMRLRMRTNAPSRPPLHPWFGSLPAILRQYRRETRDWPMPARIAGFPEYWQVVWGLDRLWKLPLLIAVKAWTKLRARLRPRSSGRMDRPEEEGTP